MTLPTTYSRISHPATVAVLPAVVLVLFGCAAPESPATSAPATPAVLFPQADAEALLTSSPQPAYPILAQAAGVTGAVHYEIDVSSEGAVIAARLIHGSPMLEQSAYDAVTRWRFQPFEVDGRPVTARTVATMLFTGQPVEPGTRAILARYADAMLRCSDADRRAAADEAESLCSAAIEVATELASFDRTSDARPLRLHAQALAALDRHEDAIAGFETVATRLRHVPVFSLDRTLALRGLGRSLVALGRDDDAVRAYGQADRQLSDALRGAERDSPFRAELVAYLQSLLPEYADVLDRIRLEAEATRVRSRLDTLQ